MIKIWNKRLFISISFTILVMLFIFSGCERAKEKSPLEKMDRLSLFSENHDVIVRFSDISEFFKAVKLSPLGKVWNSREMEGFRNGKTLEETFLAILSDQDKSVNARKINEVYLKQLKMIDGEFILGLKIDDPSKKTLFSAVAAVNQENYDESLELDKLLTELEDIKIVTTMDHFRDIPLRTIVRKEETGDETLYSAFYQGTLLESDNRAWVESSLVKLIGKKANEPEGAPTLSITGKSRLFELFEKKVKEESQKKNQNLNTEAIINALGLNAFGDIGVLLNMEPGRMNMELRVEKRGEWNRGLMVLLSSEKTPVDFKLSYLPENPTSYQVGQFNLNALWSEIPAILREISPGAEAQFNMGIGWINNMVNIDIGRDFFGNLNGLEFNYTRITENEQEFVYGMQVKNADAMSRTLSKVFDKKSPLIASFLGEFYRETDLQGQKIHTFRIPSQGPFSDNGEFTSIGVSVVDNAIAIGHEDLLTDHIQASLKKDGVPAFYNDKVFKGLIDRIPADVNGYAVTNLSKTAGFILDTIRDEIQDTQQPKNPTDEKKSSPDSDDRFKKYTDGFSYEKLPSTEFICSQLGHSESYSLVGENGLIISSSLLYPDAYGKAE